MTLKTYRIAPLSGAAPDSVVMFLHGLGDSGTGGLLQIGRIWQRALPNTEFICPDAPFPFDMAPPDFGGRQWFSLCEFTMQTITQGAREAAPILNGYIDDILAAYQLKPARLALVGFSQDTIMALHVGLRRAEKVAAIVGYSGILADAENLTAEKKSSPPVLLAHGTADDVVPFAAMGESGRALQAAGIEVTTLACPGLGHGVDDAGIEAGLDFLRRYL